MDQAEDGRSARHFTIQPDDLANVVELRDTQWLQNHGGVPAIARALHTSEEEGLSGDELSSSLQPRIDVYGSNLFKYPPPKSIFRLILRAFKDKTIIILCCAAIASLTIGLAVPDHREDYGYLEGIAIIFVVIAVVNVQAGLDREKEAKFRRLNSIKDNHNVQVLRAGVTSAVTADEVVVGDIIKVSAGDKIPADGLLLRGSALKTNESAMTGEPIDISKEPDGDVFMLSGTTVSEGVGHVLVVAVGERSQWGVILKGLVVEPENTPLQDRLDRLAWNIGKLGILFASLTFVILFIRWIVRSSEEDRWPARELLSSFIDSVTIVVVAIPEGLPLAITLGLAFAMRKMMKDNNLVRRLEACETMGSATQLNADKTGTLTQNRMTVVEADWAGNHVIYEGTDAKHADHGKISDEFRHFVAVNMSVNTQANLEFTTGGRVDHLGSKTECALLQLVHLWDMDYKVLRKNSRPHRVYMFDSIRKSMSTSEFPRGGGIRLHTKGAPEIVLKACVNRLDSNGKLSLPMDADARNDILRIVKGMARRGLRTLLMAYRDLSHDPQDADFWSSPPEANLTYLGVVGIKDPIRPETKEAVRQLKGAGVTVRMVTGDNPLTAEYIAREAGILDEDGIILEGPRFRAMKDKEVEKIALKIQVLARSTPNDKLRLVRIQKKLGEVTSVTGDGTNDGPALKEADVGFALGIAGTEIAKEACDIVILDDNIQSMTKAVLWGRSVYESIRKFLQFQLVVNIVAVTLNFISACAGVPLPLGAVPLLWVNMIMDSMGALALATEPPRPDMLNRKPYGRRAPLINRAMYRNIIGMSVFQLIVCLILQFRGADIFNRGDSEADQLEISSIIFNAFVFMQIGSEINSRRITEKNVFSGIHKSFLFNLIIAITVLVQVGLMMIVGGTSVGRSIGIGRINGAAWGVSVVLGLLVIPWGFLIRCIPLDWCYGPTDEDPTEMSKLERILHLPKRKKHTGEEEEDTVQESTEEGSSGSGTGTVDVNASSYVAGDQVVRVTGQGIQHSHPKMRLRVFVHAVAFVNVVSRSTRSMASSKEDDA